MKMSIHHLRARLSVSAEVIKKLVELEDAIGESKFTKQTIFEVTDIYSRFVEYLEYIRDPLKLYFQEKIENLFLKKAVMKTIIQEENTAKGPAKKVEILSEDFLQFSDIHELRNSVINSGSARRIDMRPSKFAEEESKAKKNMNLLMMFKVNDQMTKNSDVEQNSIKERFGAFQNNDGIIKESLDRQELLIVNKLKFRRNKNVNKEFSMRSKLINYPTKDTLDLPIKQSEAPIDKIPSSKPIVRTSEFVPELPPEFMPELPPETPPFSLHSPRGITEDLLERDSIVERRPNVIEADIEEKVPVGYGSQKRQSQMNFNSHKVIKPKNEFVMEEEEEEQAS